jgi:uncharacterized protein YjbJ (UPF0337 family)
VLDQGTMTGAGVNSTLRSRFKERWERLTDDDLEAVDGRADRLVALLRERYGYPRQRAERDLLEFLDSELEALEQSRVTAGSASLQPVPLPDRACRDAARPARLDPGATSDTFVARRQVPGDAGLRLPPPLVGLQADA